jgi:uncharacterized membrane protein
LKQKQKANHITYILPPLLFNVLFYCFEEKKNYSRFDLHNIQLIILCTKLEVVLLYLIAIIIFDFAVATGLSEKVYFVWLTFRISYIHLISLQVKYNTLYCEITCSILSDYICSNNKIYYWYDARSDAPIPDSGITGVRDYDKFSNSSADSTTELHRPGPWWRNHFMCWRHRVLVYHSVITYKTQINTMRLNLFSYYVQL